MWSMTVSSFDATTAFAADCRRIPSLHGVVRVDIANDLRHRREDVEQTEQTHFEHQLVQFRGVCSLKEEAVSREAVMLAKL